MENEETTVNIQENKSIWNTVTPLSKYLAMVLFIVMPFVGGWIGYHYAPEKIVEVEREVIKEIVVEKIVEAPAMPSEITKITFPESGELQLLLPPQWSVEVVGDGDTTRNYVLDEENKLAFELRHKIVVTSYPETVTENKRVIQTHAEPVEGLDWLNVGNVSTGFARYSPVKNGFWQGKFEIIVPISSRSYDGSVSFDSNRYQDYEQFRADQKDGQQLIEYYIANIDYVQ